MAKSKKSGNKKVNKEISAEIELEKLKLENLKLQNELEKSKLNKSSKKTKKQSHFWRSFGAVFFVILASFSFLLFSLSYAVSNTLTNTDKFVSTMQPLIKNSDIQQTLTTEITNQIFSRVDVEGELKKVLPENIQFIAGPFASQVKSFTSGKISEFLASQKAYDAWTTILKTTHSTFMKYITNENNDGIVSVNELYKLAGDNLGDSNISFLFNKTLPSQVGEIQLVKLNGVPEARNYIHILSMIPIWAFVAAVVSGILAILLALNRKKAIVAILIITLILFALKLVAVDVAIYEAGVSSPEIYSSASQAVAKILTEPIVNETIASIWFISSLLAIILVSSSLSWIVWLRKKVRYGLDWSVEKIGFKFDVPEWLIKIINWRVLIQWISVGVLYAIFAIRLPITIDGVVSALVWSAIVVSLVEILDSFVAFAKNKK